MLPASLPSSCVALDQIPSLAEPRFLPQHQLAVHGEARLGVWLVWVTALGTASYQHRENLSLYNGSWKERRRSQDWLACHPILGSNWLFTNMICCHPPESATVGKAPLETHKCLGGAPVFHDVPARSGHTAPIPPCKRQLPQQPPQQERERPVKRVGVPVTLLCNP